MTDRVEVKPELLRWALKRLGRTEEDFSSRFKKLARAVGARQGKADV